MRLIINVISEKIIGEYVWSLGVHFNVTILAHETSEGKV